MNYALITGGSRGIGRAIAVKLAQEGYHVLINYTSNDAEAQKTLELCGGQGTLMRFDVSDSEQTRAALTGWQAAHEGEYISVVINNAGIRRDNVMALMPEADWHRVLDITLSGFYNVTQPLLPAMQLHKFGRIVNMASVSGLKGLPGQTNYSAAKGGIIAATKALAQEVARRNVTVNAIAPGFIRTDMTEGLNEAELKKQMELQQQNNEQRATSKHQLALSQKQQEVTALQGEIQTLKTQLASIAKVHSAEQEKAVLEKTQEMNERLQAKDQELVSMQHECEMKLKFASEEIERYKDMKVRLSTKMLGESLEQHCYNEFMRIHPFFPYAEFHKDNDAVVGDEDDKATKGDFIFRDKDDEGTEIVSIMFEMKNEADTTATKHKNEDFLAKLDKDRKEKNCEYAVLVSLLEMDNDLYNEGIVDMSHRYEKMYVIRPQNFIPIITLLRNANLNSLSYKKQLVALRDQDMDYKNFENNMNAFKSAFAKNYELASRKFQDAIDDIDKTIKALEKTKADLLSSDRNLRLANDKAQDLSIRKLTKNAPSVAEKFNQ